MKTKKSALGRGLGAILESPQTDITSKDISGSYVVGAVADIELAKIEANPFQPRSEYEEDALTELSRSIREQGIIQPVTVRKLGYDKYQLISGERRLRAARMAGLDSIPCFIRVANDQQMLEMALIENIHREDLNALDIAISYQRLVEECKLTHEKLSQRVGKKRATISNYIRLLRLPAEIQLAIRENRISMGHARAIINIEAEKDQLDIFRKTIKNNLSVRKVEELVQGLASKSRKKEKASENIIPGHISGMLEDVESQIESKPSVRINNKGAGKLVIPFETEEKLLKILSILRQS